MRSEKGFTLVEVILAIGIFAIIAVPLVSMFLDGIRLTSKSENTTQAYAYAQQLIERMKGGETIEGEVSYLDSKKFIEGTIEGTEYTYKIEMKNIKTEEDINADRDTDGEDFYEDMATASNLFIHDDRISPLDNAATSSLSLQYDKDYIDVNSSGRWWCSIVNNEEDDEDDERYFWPSLNGVNSVCVNYSGIDEKSALRIENRSGEEINVYLINRYDNDYDLSIKPIRGKINVFGPIGIDEFNNMGTENRGRKQTAEVKVKVENTRTGEHAELTANVTYYE